MEFLRSNCIDSRVGIPIPYAITMVLPKGILMKVPYGRARDHRVHHLHHHQHHLGRGPFWVLPIWKSIDSMGLRLGLPKSDPKIVDWRDGSFWGKKSHEVAGCGIGILRMRNPLPCLVRSCQNLGGMGGGVRRRPAAAVVTPKIERRRLPS